jgi:hypothetical protein
MKTSPNIGCGAILGAVSESGKHGAGNLRLDAHPARLRNRRLLFVITNYHFEGKAIVNALQLVHLLSRAKVKVPEPLRQRNLELDRIASEPPVEPLLFPT